MVFFRNNGWRQTFSGVDYDRTGILYNRSKENPDKYFNLWVGGRTGDYGGFPWPDENSGIKVIYQQDYGETVYINDASFIPGVREDGKGYIENLEGEGTCG